MAVHDDVGLWEGGMQVGGLGGAELVTVGHHDREPVQLNLRHLRQPAPEIKAVDVAVDCRDRRQRFQLSQELGRPNVAGVEDVVDGFEGGEDVGA
jgi:hypothetical protein